MHTHIDIACLVERKNGTKIKEMSYGAFYEY